MNGITYSGKKLPPQLGLTTIELIATLAIIGILTGIGTLSMSSLYEVHNKRNAREQVQFDLLRARAIAIRSGGRAILTMGAGNNSYTVGIDYTPYSSSPFTADNTVFLRNLPKNITIVPASQIAFDPKGFLIDSSGNPTTTQIIFYYNGTQYKQGTINQVGWIN